MAIRADRVGVRQDQVDIHGRVTSPSFLNELLEDLPEWTDMPVWVNGTEELLPSNNSVPVTSPILTDIAYPDIGRDNQYFTYRESPTPVDGLAKIKSIKGNTLVWNQLVQPISKTSTSNGITYVYTTDGAIKMSGTADGTSISYTDMPNIYPGKKVLIKLENDATISNTGCYVRLATNIGGTMLYSKGVTSCNFTTLKNEIIIDVPSVDTNDNPVDFWTLLQIRIANGAEITGTLTIKPQLFDLTQMGLNITDPSEFTSLFPLSYYAYNQGSLLSFNGNGIKTVGKNLLNSVRTVGTTYTISGVNIVLREDGSYKLDGTCTGNNVLNLVTLSGVNNGVLFPKGSYVLSGSLDGISSSSVELQYYIPSIGSGNRSTSPISFALNEPTDVAIRIYVNNGRTYDDVVYPMLRFADVEDSTFEPYTTQTTNLPVATYFPTGMKSAGTVYDELTPRKAITRIGAVDLGSLDWIHRTEISQGIFSCNVTSSVLYKRQTSVNFEVAKYINGGTVTGVTDMVEKDNMTVCVYHTGNNTDRYIYIKDTSFNDATALKNSLQGIYLFYELATPVELPTMSFE